MKGILTRSDLSPGRSAFRIAGIYMVIGLSWILLSDWAIATLLGTSPVAHLANLFKGWGFIIISAVILFVLTRNTVKSIQRSEDSLREHQRILYTLFENLPGMAYRCKADVDCPIEFVSAGSLELTGFPPSELSDKQKITDLVLGEDRETVRIETELALADKRPFRLVYRIRTAEGAIKWVWEQGLGIYSPDGSLVAIEGFITDITERKHAEEALIRSEEIYRALVEGTSDAILMVDRNRNIISVNKAFLELFGYTREELEGKTVRIVHRSDESFNGFTKVTYPAVESAPVRFEWELMRKDGTVFPIEGTYSAIR
ncbi:MAG: PAS domain S-box protein, partial [Syntrophobacteraceae bacterium]